jgi:hypothetical protein
MLKTNKLGSPVQKELLKRFFMVHYVAGQSPHVNITFCGYCSTVRKPASDEFYIVFGQIN